MTKLPWQGKEFKADHEVFVPTKPGECILVDQMTSTEVGFFAQLKGKLTKKRYKCATVFVDHFICLHLNTSNLTTSPTKHLPPSLPSSSTQQSLESRSYFITATMYASMIMPSGKRAMMQGNNSPSVGSMPIFKMALPSKPSGTSWKAHGSNCSMRVLAGRRQSTLHCGHKPCKMKLTFTTTYQCWRMAHLGWSFSAQFK